MSDAVFTALIALVVGAVGSLAAPWAQWGVEKRRERMSHRRSLVKSWRDGLSEWEAAKDRKALDRTSSPSFLTRPWYGSLRPHMDEAARKKVESNHVLISTRARDPYAQTLQDEIDRVEAEWKLR